MGFWGAEAAGVLQLPSGRLVRGRGLHQAPPEAPWPEFGLYLLKDAPAPGLWPARWVRWPDFGLPANSADAADALRETWRRAADERVEIGCAGGRGRTGTALACIAVLDGVPPAKAVAYVRARYDRRAVESPSQARFVRQSRST